VTVDENLLAEQFEGYRNHLRAVAYRMLGSTGEADDAVQEAWLRLSRSDADDIENLGGWLTTVVARVCLDVLRSRTSRREEPLDLHLPDPVVTAEDEVDPENEAVLADSVGLALLVVLDTLTPAERLAFVLRDMFAMPFDEIARIVGRSPDATRQLASRARHRVQGAPAPDADLARQRRVVDAFLAASRNGEFDALVAVLHPDVLLRSDGGTAAGATRIVRGAAEVAGQSITFNRLGGRDATVRKAVVNGVPGLVAFRDGKPFSLLAFTVIHDRIVEIDIITDPERFDRIDLSAIGG
jgi:RNA polymerase sigma factor (sigma-70 family)